MRPALLLPTLILAASMLAACAHDRAADRAHRACLDRCEARNHGCVMNATTSAALDGCSQEASWCVQSCRR